MPTSGNKMPFLAKQIKRGSSHTSADRVKPDMTDCVLPHWSKLWSCVFHVNFMGPIKAASWGTWSALLIRADIDAACNAHTSVCSHSRSSWLTAQWRTTRGSDDSVKALENNTGSVPFMMETCWRQKSFAGKQRFCFVLRQRAEPRAAPHLHYSDVKALLVWALLLRLVCLPGGSHAHVNACKLSPPPPPALRAEPAVPLHLHCKVTSHIHCVVSTLPTFPDHSRKDLLHQLKLKGHVWTCLLAPFQKS